MKTMGISKFKSHALKILDQVAKTQEIIVITKRGKPLAQITPYRNSEINPKPGKLSDALVFEEDIISPLGEEMWDACK
jgi:prevent-host-death family protein